jgi:hypothetical protein
MIPLSAGHFVFTHVSQQLMYVCSPQLCMFHGVPFISSSAFRNRAQTV